MATPESGKSKGLTLMLDAHNDIISTSSPLNTFMVGYNCHDKRFSK